MTRCLPKTNEEQTYIKLEINCKVQTLDLSLESFLVITPADTACLICLQTVLIVSGTMPYSF